MPRGCGGKTRDSPRFTETPKARQGAQTPCRAFLLPGGSALEQPVEIDMEAAAGVAKVSVDGIRALLRRNKVEVRRYGSRRTYVRLEDLLALLKVRSVR